LDAAAAARGIQEKCAEPLGLDLLEAANGIIEIANAAMINAVRIATVRRGYDPRDLVMVAFGGGGPLHANRLADEMKIPLLVVPMSPGTTSALGLLATDLKHEFSRTRLMRAAHADVNLINTIFAAMERQGGEVLRLEGVPDKAMSFLREIEMRYVGQSYELGVVCPGGVLSPEDLKATCSRFHAEHERTYGRGYPQEAVELVNFRLTAVGAIDKPQLRKITTEAPLDAHVTGPRPVFFAEAGGFTETAVYDRYLLWAGQKIEGPAVIEEMDSNTLIHPGFRAVVDPFGNLLISRAH
jgi:N-methylhydantoinase A